MCPPHTPPGSGSFGEEEEERMQEPEEGKVPWDASSGYDKAVVLNHSQHLLSPAESLQKIKPVNFPVRALCAGWRS